MNSNAQFENSASRSRSKHEGESSYALCDRLSRTRDTSQRQLPTDQDYAVSTREYQTDQSSLKPAPAAAGPVLEKRQRQQQQKQPHKLQRLTGSLHIRALSLRSPVFMTSGREWTRIETTQRTTRGRHLPPCCLSSSAVDSANKTRESHRGDGSFGRKNIAGAVYSKLISGHLFHSVCQGLRSRRSVPTIVLLKGHSCGEKFIEEFFQAQSLCDLASGDRRLCDSACPAPSRGFSQPHHLVLRLGKIHR